YQARFIELADTINSAMPEHVVGLVAEGLNKQKKAVNGSSVLVVGVAYKRDVADYRESPSFDVIHSLQKLGAQVSYMDPHVPECDEHGVQMRSVGNNPKYGDYDAVVIVTDHSSIDYRRMVAEAKLVIDTRDALRNVPHDPGKVVRL